jgi:hypothetical protein
MLDWYLTHVYVLPWWAYALAAYPLVGAFAFRCMQLIHHDHPPPIELAAVVVITWPLVTLLYSVAFGVQVSGWLLGFTDTPPLSLSKEGGYIE